MEDSNEDRAGFFSGGPEYKMMNMAIFSMTIVLSFDFMATFISIPFYWEQVSQGELDRFYGVFFASYQLGSLVGAPVLAKWTQLRGVREPAVLALGLDCIGNVIYVLGSAFAPGSALGITALVVGRLISGFGGAGLTVSMVYLVKLNLGKNSLLAMNSFRSWQFWGKLAGPVVGTLFLYTPVLAIGDNFELNYATFPPLCTAVLDVGALVAVVALSRPLPEVPAGEKIPFMQDPAAKLMLKDAAIVCAMYTVGSMCLWIIFSQIMTVGVVLFQIADTLDTAENLWYIYLPPIIGAFLSLFGLRILMKTVTLKEYHLMIGAMVALCLSLFCFFEYQEKEVSWIYYIGGTILFLSNGIFVTSYRGVYADIVGDSRHLDMMMALVLMASSLGSILGSFISGSVVTVGQIDACASVCDPSLYQYECCEMVGLNAVVLAGVICMGVALLAAVLAFVPSPRLASLKYKAASILPDRGGYEAVQANDAYGSVSTF